MDKPATKIHLQIVQDAPDCQPAIAASPAPSAVLPFIMPPYYRRPVLSEGFRWMAGGVYAGPIDLSAWSAVPPGAGTPGQRRTPTTYPRRQPF